jgi:hypothetical protein
MDDRGNESVLLTSVLIICDLEFKKEEEEEEGENCAEGKDFWTKFRGNDIEV